MGHWPGDTGRYEHESRIFYASKYPRQSTNSIKINCHRKLKCFTSLTWPPVMCFWMTTIAVVISLIRKFYPHTLPSSFVRYFIERQSDTYTDKLRHRQIIFFRLVLRKRQLSFWGRFERQPTDATQTYTHTRAPTRNRTFVYLLISKRNFIRTTKNRQPNTRLLWVN